jgi:hypothetical protein
MPSSIGATGSRPPSPSRSLAPSSPAPKPVPVDQLEARRSSSGPALNAAPPVRAGAAHPAEAEGMYAHFGDAFRFQRRDLSGGRSVLVATEPHVTDADVDAQLAHLARVDDAVGDVLAKPQPLTLVVRQFDSPRYDSSSTLVTGLLEATDRTGLRNATARESFGRGGIELAPVTVEKRAELLATGALTLRSPAVMSHEYGHGLFRTELGALDNQLGQLARTFTDQMGTVDDALLSRYHTGIAAELKRNGDGEGAKVEAARAKGFQEKYEAASEAFSQTHGTLAFQILGGEMRSHDELMADVVAVVTIQDLGALVAEVGEGRSFDRARYQRDWMESQYRFLDKLRLAIGDQLKPVFAQHDPATRKAEGQRILKAVFETLAADGLAMISDEAVRPSKAWVTPWGQIDDAKLEAYNDRLIADFKQRCEA